jgi:hypothetical protein
VENENSRVTFILPTGSTLTFERDAMQPMLGGGYGEWGLYVDFNRTDQEILLSGGGAGLATALCFIPGVGIPMCIVAATVAGAATAALVAQGTCGGTMRVWAQLFGYTECVWPCSTNHRAAQRGTFAFAQVPL